MAAGEPRRRNNAPLPPERHASTRTTSHDLVHLQCTLPLSYAVHSGSGVQLQALTAAVFVANATGRALVVPPWLIHHDMPKKAL